jgi:hypothetical protein
MDLVLSNRGVSRTTRYGGIALLVVAAMACDFLKLGSSTDSGSGGGATEGDGGTVTGSDCGTDTTTGVTLCLGISLCSDVTVDTEVFPACGFRVSGSAIDIECVCGSWLCPLGTTASCDAAAKLLSEQNEGTVCARASAGECTELSVKTSSSSSGSGTCNTVCRDECAGDPTCIVACGC